MNSKLAKEVYKNIEDLNILRGCFRRNPSLKKKLLNKLKEQEITDKSGLESLRMIANNRNATIDELSELDWDSIL